MAKYPLLEKFQKSIQNPPALSLGLSVFMVVLYCLSLFYPWIQADLRLQSTALTSFELNRLSFYPLIHKNVFHLVINVISLQPILSQFERVNGTVRTGVVLNVLAVVTAIPYCLLSLAFFPDSAVLGASAWIFSFMGYWALKEASSHPTTQLAPNVIVPTWLLPIIYLVVIAVIIPGSSFIGHLLGLVVGWLFALGYLDPLIEPSSKVVLWIEKKISKAIDLIPSIVTFYREEAAVDSRAQARTESGRSMSISGGLGVNHGDLESGTQCRDESGAPPASGFPGQGQTLGA